MATEPEVKEYLAKPYSRVLLPDPAGGYFAEVPELSGCFSEGPSPGEAVANLEEAMAGWFESALEASETIPEPFATRGFSGHVALRLPKSLHKEAIRRAAAEGTSLNQYLVSAIASRLGADDLADRLADRLAPRLRFVAQMGVAVSTTSQPEPKTISAIGQLEEGDTAQYEHVGSQLARRERSHA